MTRQVADLVKLNLSEDGSSPAEKALLGQIPAGQLTGDDKQQYVDLLTHAMNSYLHYNMFPQAQEQVAALKQLGQDTTRAGEQDRLHAHQL